MSARGPGPDDLREAGEPGDLVLLIQQDEASRGASDDGQVGSGLAVGQHAELATAVGR